MNIYVVSRKLLIAQIEDAYAKGYVYYERDVLLPHIRDWNVQGYAFSGYIALIHDFTAKHLRHEAVCHHKEKYHCARIFQD